MTVDMTFIFVVLFNDSNWRTNWRKSYKGNNFKHKLPRPQYQKVFKGNSFTYNRDMLSPNRSACQGCRASMDNKKYAHPGRRAKKWVQELWWRMAKLYTYLRSKPKRRKTGTHMEPQKSSKSHPRGLKIHAQIEANKRVCANLTSFLYFVRRAKKWVQEFWQKMGKPYTSVKVQVQAKRNKKWDSHGAPLTQGG